MDEKLYRWLMRIALILTLAWLAWTLYDSFVRHAAPGDYAYHAGSNYFADGYYDKAIEEYDRALQEAPDHIPALRGRAETLIMLHREREALALYDELVALQPDNPRHYANRGIAHDRLGEYRKALADYEKSLSLDPEVGEGPGWLTRFFRNQPQKPPGIVDRARYLKHQLALPESQRLLSVPTMDEAQRPYKE
ncbi:MAG: tetratricopeptide repeat protein [Gammaproteobacteria bacterium]|nr:tetratricopeptide repeat protein [Gammaproteobacteria bacterium]